MGKFFMCEGHNWLYATKRGDVLAVLRSGESVT